MSIEDFSDRHSGNVICIVCGKSLRPGEVLGTIYKDSSRLPICCPLCLEAYERDRQKYLSRLAKRAFQEELRNLSE